MPALGKRMKDYGSLIKGLQTGLLLFTGLAGYASSRSPVTAWQIALGLSGSLFLTISGSTALNMVCDRDIDARMQRAHLRPLPAGRLGLTEATLFGLALAAGGVGWAYALSPLYGSVVLAGLACDVLVYTVWLKRRTPWSIIWGGLAGGMPVLAGRVLGTGRMDLLGVVLAMAVLAWIPTHIMTYSMKYARDYERAGVPVFPNTCGLRRTQQLIALSTVLAGGAMLSAASLLSVPRGYLWLTVLLSLALTGLALASVISPTPRRNFQLFKFASLYMLGAMGLIATGAWF